jgi:hypothetical protein
MRKKKQTRAKKKALDEILPKVAISKKKERGRPRFTEWEWVASRALDLQTQLSYVWFTLESPLLEAKTENEVTNAFKTFANFCAATFVPVFSADILTLLKDEDFPQRADPRTKFLARSLAGRFSAETPLTFRSSRDICEKVAKQKRESRHKILRREFYIECSCGYKGPAFDNACWKCGAQPQLSLYEWTGKAPEDVPVAREIKVRQSPQKEVAQHVSQADSPDYNHVRCDECGTTIAAETRELALAELAEHKRLFHGDNADKQAEKPE